MLPKDSWGHILCHEAIKLDISNKCLIRKKKKNYHQNVKKINIEATIRFLEET